MEPKEFTEFLLKCITTGAGFPEVDFNPESSLVVAQVDAKDQGRVIGKKGITVSAVSILIWYHGLARLGEPVVFKLLEPETISTLPAMPFMPKERADIEMMQSFLKTVFRELNIKKWKFKFICSPTAARTDTVVKVDFTNANKEKFADPDFFSALATLIRTVSKFHGAAIEPQFTFSDALQ
jgi:predicted RNA-binding protein YlqC (UPF0109 family)